MSLAHALTSPYDRTPATDSSRPDSVKERLTPKRPRRPVENDEYADSPAASCAPTAAASPKATSTPWRTCAISPPRSTPPWEMP
jgi:hypothetical protein